MKDKEKIEYYVDNVIFNINVLSNKIEILSNLLRVDLDMTARNKIQIDDNTKTIKQMNCEHADTILETITRTFPSHIKPVVTTAVKCKYCDKTIKIVHNNKERYEYLKEKYETKLKNINEQLDKCKEK